ncbi:hypothetical protein [Ekhidna sp.]
MSIFEFHIAERNLETAELSELEIASRLFRCTTEIQIILKEIAVSGKAVITQEGVRKGAEIIEALSSAPFIVKNDFNILCEPLFMKIESHGNTLTIIGTKSNFYRTLGKMLGAYELPNVFLKNQSTCRFYFYWLKDGRSDKIKLVYKELRDLLDLKKDNYKAFVHYKRVLTTIQKELKGVGVEMSFTKYPINEERSSGVEIEVVEKGNI